MFVIYIYANHPCKSELAREKPENKTFNQETHVIVNDLREQARSYRKAKKTPLPKERRFFEEQP
ncbi:MAG: hypothetical protein ACRESJ_10640 [Pseudomonas sp.]|uniref:hypothetical protein n=1 Tax=Pseudomonas sp. TaxID=306 RepID=UPI003D6F1487